MAAVTLRTLTDGVHVAEAHQRFVGLEVGARMTVLDTPAGRLVHSPIAGSVSAVEATGAPAWVLAPNLLHHLYAGPWADAGYPVWAAPGLVEKRPDVAFAGVVEAGTRPFGPDIEVLPLTCLPMTNEVVVLHRPSRTLVVTDLVFHFTAAAPFATRVAMRALGGYPGCRTTVLERVAIRRDAARDELGRIAAWDFDRLIMAHGAIIETGARERFVDAFRWLGIDV